MFVSVSVDVSLSDILDEAGVSDVLDYLDKDDILEYLAMQDDDGFVNQRERLRELYHRREELGLDTDIDIWEQIGNIVGVVFPRVLL